MCSRISKYPVYSNNCSWQNRYYIKQSRLWVCFISFLLEEKMFLLYFKSTNLRKDYFFRCAHWSAQITLVKTFLIFVLILSIFAMLIPKITSMLSCHKISLRTCVDICYIDVYNLSKLLIADFMQVDTYPIYNALKYI